jgi:hypothetical protein
MGKAQPQKSGLSAVIYFHAQSTIIDLVFSESGVGVPSGNRANASINQIITADSGSTAPSKPSLNIRKSLFNQNFDPLIAAYSRLLPFQVNPAVENPENEFGMRLANGYLTIRRDEIIDFLYFVPNIPELTGYTHPHALVEPIVLVGGRLTGKPPQVSTSPEKHRRA